MTFASERKLESKAKSMSKTIGGLLTSIHVKSGLFANAVVRKVARQQARTKVGDDSVTPPEFFESNRSFFSFSGKPGITIMT